MHHVKRSLCPNLLTDHKDKWTAPWVAHYRWGQFGPERHKQPNKPTTGHWRKEDIRLSLTSDFSDNCGYCGMLVPKPMLDGKNKVSTGMGDVDHFLAKSIYPELVYEWTNFVWSCKPCNNKKGEFDNPQHPLLNPCSKEDCQSLHFIEDNGSYVLHPNKAVDINWQQRLKYTERQTLLNSKDIRTVRCNNVFLLRGCFESITNLLPSLALAPFIQPQIDKHINEIKIHVNSPQFHLLIQQKYQSLLQQYPQIAMLLNND